VKETEMPRIDVEIPTNDGAAKGSLHVPDGEGPWPGVVMFPDAFGLRDTMRDMGDQLAGLGYVVLVPDIFYRAGDWAPFDPRTAFSDEQERNRLFGLIGSLSNERTIADADAYADFLLDHARPIEVVALLRDKTRADPLLLRYALALQAQNSNDLAARVEQLNDRFAASRLRGDRVHLREEARFTLHLLSDPTAALRLAQANWQVQKEPADVGILREAAIAAHDAVAAGKVNEWLRDTGLEDVRLQPITLPRR